MAHGPLYRVAFRRRREGKTDYRRRLGLLKGGEARAVVRRSNRNVIVQFIEYNETGDRVVAQAEARELTELGYPASASAAAAYLTGRLAAKRAKEAGLDNSVLDIGREQPHKGGVLFAALKGVVDGGVKVPHGDGILPAEERVRGEHLGEQKAAAFAAAYQKITGAPLPPKAEKPKKGGKPGKGDAPKGDAGQAKKAKTPK